MQECHRASKEYWSQGRSLKYQRQDMFGPVYKQEQTGSSNGAANDGYVIFLLDLGSDNLKCSHDLPVLCQKTVTGLLLCNSAPYEQSILLPQNNWVATCGVCYLPLTDWPMDQRQLPEDRQTVESLA